MRLVTSIDEMRRLCKAIRCEAEHQTLALIPTMGALHEGHLSLIRAARKSPDRVAASIFVNPLQFGPNEDLSKYPRTFEEDCAMLEREGVDLLFTPTVEEMYPAGTQTWVDVPEIGGRLDGASRPGHFRGVATVVTKLFHIVQPDRAFFGQKDAAQVAILQAMVRDLNFDLEIVVCPTIRDEDGLALSSRNRYLTAEERKRALVLSRSLRKVERAVAEGQHAASPLYDLLLQELQTADGIRLDYAEIVDPQTLEPLNDVICGALVAVAAWVGTTRLIDNILITPRKASVC
ncbi:pantoate--beta-alanine ligase [Granulicella sp. dw_53]|uniref:pantoate--beta-alanine ligase n=1 Tax=Granulicella sp. dw_53 TaxID=2719792 RepID=UPI001BD6B93B|nr:pantoate--beta-alanine ligase [Granulicella sp. dw_53]